jgi:cytidylate kinase
VVDGRDIGSNVFPSAEYKFFLTASPEERARRRYLELQAKGDDTDYETVLADINARDHYDATRELNPLVVAEGAQTIVTDDMNAAQVAGAIVARVRGKGSW